MKSILPAFLLSILVVNQSLANDAPIVAAASSLRQVWPLLMQAYSAAEKPRVTFGSSGNLSRQIQQGAPFDLFLSADQSYPEKLYSDNISTTKPTQYATGALAWIALPGTPVAVWLDNAAGRKNAMASFPFSDVAKLAIANPAFAPYGRAAQQVLATSNTNQLHKIKYTHGENAAQTLQFALSGATDGGIVPLSLVSAAAKIQLPKVAVRQIPASLHSPLEHTMVLIGEPTDNAQSLFDFLLSQKAQLIFEQNGFRAIE